MKKLLIITIFTLWGLTGALPARAAAELTLDQAMDTALANHPALAELRATVEQYRQRLGQSRAALFPTLDYQISASTVVDDVNATSAGAPAASSAALSSLLSRDEGAVTNALSLNYVLYDAGRRQGIKSSENFLTAAEKDLERFRDQLGVNVFTAFMGAYLAGNALDVQIQSSAYYATLKQEALARFEEGLIPESDYLTFANAYDQARIQEMNYTLQMRQAVISLENLMHEPLAADVALTLPAPPAPGGVACDEAALVLLALDRRQDVLATRDRVRALDHAARQVRGTLKPSVTVGAQYQHSENDFSDIGTNDDMTSIFAQMNWRLSDGRKRVHAAAEVDAQSDQAQARLDSLEWSVRREVRDACFRMDNAGARIAVLENTLKDAAKNLEILTLRYKEGLNTVTIITDAELNLTRARLSMIQARTDLALARRALNLAIGGTQQ